AAVDVDQRAGLGAMVVIVQADAEVLGGVPARADAGIPAAAVRIAAAAHAQILADGVVVVGGVVRCPEVAAAHADVPGGVDVDTRVRARGPAAQRIARFGLVHVVVVEHVADAEVAEVDVAQLGAHAPAVADLPAIAAGHAIAGFAAAVALEEVEVAGTEAPGSTAIGTPDVAGDEPCAFAGRQAGTVGVAGSALCKCKGGEHRRNQRGRNQGLLHWAFLIFGMRSHERHACVMQPTTSSAAGPALQMAQTEAHANLHAACTAWVRGGFTCVPRCGAGGPAVPSSLPRGRGEGGDGGAPQARVEVARRSACPHPNPPPHAGEGAGGRVSTNERLRKWEKKHAKTSTAQRTVEVVMKKLPLATQLPAFSRASSASFGRPTSAAAMMSSSCSRLVALAIGAVTPGRVISQASETWAGVAPTSADTLRSISSSFMPRSSKSPSRNAARAAPLRSSLLAYLPVRKPLAREK